MPTFRTKPSSNLNAAISRMVAAGGDKLGPLGEIQATQAAASTARSMSLAEKARAEVEQMQRAQGQRNDPAVQAQYAGDVAGIDTPDATRLYKAVRGVSERPVIEMDNGDEGLTAPDGVTANRMPDVTFAKPENLPAGAERLFRSALASVTANNIATGHTNAQQLAQAGGTVNKAALVNQAANTDSVPDANRIVAATAGHLRNPFGTGPQGQILNRETGDVNEGTELTQGAVKLAGARAAAAGALATSRGNTAAAGATGDAPVDALPGGTGSKMMQEADSGQKYAVNEKTGRAWKATASGWEPVLVTNLPKNLQKFGTGAATQGNRESVFTQRVIQSGNQAAHDLHNVVQLPLSASTGTFGGRKQGPGLMDATKEVMANKLTGQEVQSYNVMSTGFQRALATIETQGLAPAGSLTHQMDAVLFKEGDTNLTKLHKLAQIRQIVGSGMEVILDNPRVSEMEKGRIRKVLDRVNAAVPFTHEDLIKLDQAQQIDPAATMASVLKAKAAAPAKKEAAPTNAKGWKLMVDGKKNRAYVSPDGKEFEELEE